MVHKLQLENGSPPISRLRSIISQVIACMFPSLLVMDIQMAVSFPTVAVPSLLDAKHGLSLNDYETSWFGSLSFLTHPIGAVMTGPMVDYFGRKTSCFLVTIPHLVAWTLMYYSWDVPSLLIACGLLGLGNGLMEGPLNSYVGEVSETSLRSVLYAVTVVFGAAGILGIYYLGLVLNWRTISLLCLIVPVCSTLLGFVIPESPIWLLVNGKDKRAMKSLCYLRGWTTADNVKIEFDELVDYSKMLKQCVICVKTEKESPPNCPHENMNWFKRSIITFRYVMLCKETLRPLWLVVLYFTVYNLSGLTPIRSNMVNVCDAFGMTVDGKNVVSMVGLINFITTILVIFVIKFIGKRKLVVSALLGTAISCTILSLYAKKYLPDSVFSYDVATFPKEKSYFPLVIFYLMVAFTGLGIPWVLVGEIFPFRSRATSQGLAAASCYISMFIGSKTLICLETSVGLHGSFAVYAAFGFLGAIVLYFFLPETEGKSMQEIEDYFNGKFRTFADDPIINTVKKLKNCCRRRSKLTITST